MNYDECKFTINSTWTATGDSVAMEEIVSVEKINDSEWMQFSEGEIGHLSQLEDDENFKPLQFISENNNESCRLSLEIKDPLIKITKLTIISEARIIEFYGKHGEYICTEKGHQIGCIAERKIYLVQTNICATKEITIKFCTNDNSMWIYGITLFTDGSNQSTCTSIIDYAKVEQMLLNSNVHLSENAEQAKTFIMAYNKSRDENNVTKNLHDFLQIWNSLNGNRKTLSKIKTIFNVNKNGNESTENSNESTENGNESTENSNESTENGNESTENGNIVEEKDDVNGLKNYVDQKMQQLEERVQNNLKITLKEFEQKQNEKLDNIIKLLEKK